MTKVVSRMHTGLSPEWDRGFDEAFIDLVSHDDDLVRAEFTGLMQRSWPTRPNSEGTTDVCEDR